MKKYINICLFCLLAALPLCGDTKVKVSSAKLDQFIITPNSRGRLEFVLGNPRKNMAYVLKDYWNKVVLSGKTVVEKKKAVLHLNLPQGYYTLKFNSCKEEFGIFVVPENLPSDNFFALDAWLTGGKEWGEKSKRPALIRILKRCGITQVRDRINWTWINPASGKWNFNYSRREYLTLAEQYRRNGIKQMIAYCHSPKWLGGGNRTYPKDIAGAKISWTAMLNKMGFDWFALEAWNEPDIGFSSNMPADQYMTFTRMLASAMRHADSKLPLVGGVFAHYNKAFITTSIENGLLECSDIISFHTYEDADKLVKLTEKYQNTFAKYGHREIPLWISEAGLLYTGEGKFSDWRFSSARDIVRKAVEAKACGITKFFPFVYVAWEYRGRKTGLMNLNDSPRRLWASYITAKRILANKKFIGELSPKAVSCSNKVFDNGNGTATVVNFPGEPDLELTFDCKLKFDQLIGADGREMSVSTGKVPAPDGVCYGIIRLASIKSSLQKSRQQKSSQKNGIKRNSDKYDWNIIPAANLSRAEFSPCSTGYIAMNTGKAKTVSARVYNTSNKASLIKASYSARAESTGETLNFKFPECNIPAGKHVTLNWQFDRDQISKLAGATSIRLNIEKKDKLVLPLVMKFWFEMSLEKQLAQFSKQIKLPITNLPRWEKLAYPADGLKLSVYNNIWTADAALPTSKGSWAFPRFRLPEGVDVTNADGMVLRVRNSAAAGNNLLALVWENDDVAYKPASPVVPADGLWHVVYIPFDSLVHNQSNAPDANEKLDLDLVKNLSIGLYGCKAEKNKIEVSHWYLVSKK